MLPYNQTLKLRARELRKNATPQENKLWYHFLRKQECQFLRQKVIDNYIVDFYCHAKKLVIEVDGNQHHTEDGMEYDQVRTGLLEASGLYVMRFTNAEVDHSFKRVCEKIQFYIDEVSM